MGLQNLLTARLEASSAHFGFQTFYQLRFCWLFILFFTRSAKCPSWVHKQVGSALTYIAAIFSLPT